MLSTPLGASAQSTYAELLEVTRHRELARTVQDLSGSFNKKTVKDIPYWYYQYTDIGGALRQVFVGRDEPKIRALVEKAREKDTASLDTLAKAAITLGCAATTPVHFRILRRMNEIGFFRAGGVLIGTHAFFAYGNMLGVAWTDRTGTQDIDFAHSGKNVEIALPANLEIDTRDALASLEAGLLPVPGLKPGERTGSFLSKTDRQLRVDFIGAMVGGQERVYEHPTLGISLQPLRFLDFVLQDIDQAVVVSSIGAVLVNVPDPARFALHKMLVHADRRTRNPLKASKDLRQAAALLEVLEASRSDHIADLWKEILHNGSGWAKRARESFVALRKLSPDLAILEAMEAVRA
jgi:hypothetical protein